MKLFGRSRRETEAGRAGSGPVLRSGTLRTRHGKRTLCVPARPPGDKPAHALVLGFHGGNGQAQYFATMSGLTQAFHAFGQDVVFPQARRHWSDGRPTLESGWAGDLDLVGTLVSRQRAAFPEGEAPLAVIGYSNGGIFALRLACEMRTPPAITVAAAAALPEAVAARAADGPPAPVMLVQAADDMVVRWEGGEVTQIGEWTARGALLGADETVAFWRRRNRISAPARRKEARIGDSPVRVEFWPGGPDGADLWRVVIQRGGHRQFEGDGTAPPGSLPDLIARTVLWYVDRDRLTAGRAGDELSGETVT